MTSSAIGKNFTLGKTYDNAPKFSVSPVSAELDAEGGTVSFQIIASGTSSYTVETDADWLTLISKPTSGTSVISARASANTGKARTAHIIVSEKATTSGVSVTLKNILTVTQHNSGLNIGIADWEDGDDDGGMAD